MLWLEPPGTLLPLDYVLEQGTFTPCGDGNTLDAIRQNG